MSNYLDTMFDETKNINDNAYVLQSLSRAFYATGNTHVGDELSFIAGSLLKSSKNINNAVGQESTDRLNQSYQATANMVGAALAMCRMEEGK